MNKQFEASHSTDLMFALNLSLIGINVKETKQST